MNPHAGSESSRASLDNSCLNGGRAQVLDSRVPSAETPQAETPQHPTASRAKKNTLGRTEGAECPGDDLLSRVSTIIGETCLTTVFGMGTGMARFPCSPGMLVTIPSLGGPRTVV